jgi:uncharacterized membrane protein
MRTIQDSMYSSRVVLTLVVIVPLSVADVMTALGLTEWSGSGEADCCGCSLGFTFLAT